MSYLVDRLLDQVEHYETEPLLDLERLVADPFNGEYLKRKTKAELIDLLGYAVEQWSVLDDELHDYADQAFRAKRLT